MSAEPERIPSLSSKGRQVTPARLNTPKKDKVTRRESSVVDTLKSYDDQLEVIPKFNERIVKFEELLHKMKTDLYGLVESMTEKINKTIVQADLPKRGVPRIISDIQLVPPRSTPGQAQIAQDESEPFSDLESWSEVTNKKNKRRQVRIAAGLDLGPPDVAARPAATEKSVEGRPNPPSNSSNMCRRAPRNAAVAIKANSDGLSYADVIKQAREKVSLKDIGIVNPRMRRAANGGVIIEIGGPEGTVKADTLAS